MSPARPIASVAGLGRTFGRRSALRDVTFELAPGEVFALLGPNGSGKSTLLRLLTGYLRPTTGAASIAGHDVVRDPLGARRHIGYVPEDVPLYPHLRVEEFLRLMAHLKGVERGTVDTRIRAVAAALELDDVLGRIVRELSHGFRQRVGIAQALIGDPPLLILDEPTNGLDPRQIVECRAIIQRLAGRHTVLITSHVLSEVEKIADRVGFLRDGCLLAVETLDRAGTGPDLETRFLALTDTRS